MNIGERRTPWFPSMHFTLNTPYETSGNNTQCIIEKIDFDIENGKADITAIIIDISDAVDIDINDSYNSFAPTWADWQNSYSTKAEAPSNSYDIQAI
jgi:hypothetical protein